MTHDYKRNGTTTLFAAPNLLDGTVIGRWHRHQEFIRFLNDVQEQRLAAVADENKSVMGNNRLARLGLCGGEARTGRTDSVKRLQD